jgi:hypothetical protein
MTLMMNANSHDLEETFSRRKRNPKVERMARIMNCFFVNEINIKK